MANFIALATLSNLTELRINCLVSVDISLYQLEEAQIGPLASLRILKLDYIKLLFGSNSLGAKFCRVFSKMFPNLEELTIRSATPIYDISSHLDHFVNLRKHHIR